MKTLIKIIMNFFSAEFIGWIMAVGISKLISYASKRGGNTWKTVKGVMKKTENWIALFNEVYEDDEMTAEEEKKIAEAISNMTSAKKIKQIIGSKKPD